MIGLIARAEMNGALRGPVAWLLFGALQFVGAWLFFLFVEDYLLASAAGNAATELGLTNLVVARTFVFVPFLLLLFVPLLTMRAIAQERSDGSFDLLRAAPVSAAQIVLGKFLACSAIAAVPLLLIALMPICLLAGGSIDFGQYLSGLLGLTLCTLLFVACGLWVSSLTRNPALAAGGAMLLLVLLWLFGVRGAGEDTLLALLSPQPHYSALLRGVIDSFDLAYFVLATAMFLLLAVVRLATARSL